MDRSPHAASPLPPQCPACGGLARPAVVWFGEMLDPADLARADRACRCDVFVVVGTSAIVYPAAGLADVARSRGALVIEINVEPTTPTARDFSLQGPAETVLPKIERRLLA